MAARKRKRADSKDETPSLSKGARVRLDGLEAAAHLNGQTGICQSFDDAAGHWLVLLEGSLEQQSLKPDNLELLEEPPEESDEDDDEAPSGRMASDPESAFISCDSLAAAREASEDGEKQLEFNCISARDELSSCLDFVEELLDGSKSSERPLRGLSFAACSLDADDILRLAGLLKLDAGQKLTALGVSKTPDVPAKSWKELFASLPAGVTWLDFGDNKLSDADLAPLFEGLEGREDLDKLYLDGNRIKDLSRLCRSLPDTGITNLDLGDNQVDDVNVELLAMVLPKSVVMILVIGSNDISADGATTLFQVLPRTSLDVLYIDSTSVDDTSLAALGLALKDAKLTELHLDNTKITDAGIRDLIPHIGANELTYVDISGNDVSDETTKLLEAALSEEKQTQMEDAIPEEAEAFPQEASSGNSGKGVGGGYTSGVA